MERKRRMLQCMWIAGKEIMSEIMYTGQDDLGWQAWNGSWFYTITIIWWTKQNYILLAEKDKHWGGGWRNKNGRGRWRWKREKKNER